MTNARSCLAESERIGRSGECRLQSSPIVKIRNAIEVSFLFFSFVISPVNRFVDTVRRTSSQYSCFFRLAQTRARVHQYAMEEIDHTRRIVDEKQAEDK